MEFHSVVFIVKYNVLYNFASLFGDENTIVLKIYEDFYKKFTDTCVSDWEKKK